jgi:hypothetical protein
VIEHVLADPDMRRIMDRQVCLGDFPKQMRVDIATKFALGHRTEDETDPLRGESSATFAYPQRVIRDRLVGSAY